MEQLEEITQSSDEDGSLLETCKECKYAGNWFFAVGTGIAISGGLLGAYGLGAYSLILVGGYAVAGGAALRITAGYTERCYNRRRNNSAQMN